MVDVIGKDEELHGVINTVTTDIVKTFTNKNCIVME